MTTIIISIILNLLVGTPKEDSKTQDTNTTSTTTTSTTGTSTTGTFTTMGGTGTWTNTDK